MNYEFLRLYNQIDKKPTSHKVDEQPNDSQDQESVSFDNDKLYSFKDLLDSNYESIINQIYVITNNENENNYVQIKLTKMNISDEERVLIQMVDISDTILYQQQKNQNDQLALINVTVSHELRNPLNSIKARNLEKYYLYKLLINCLNEMPENLDKNI